MFIEDIEAEFTQDTKKTKHKKTISSK